MANDKSVIKLKRTAKGHADHVCVGLYLTKERHAWFKKRGININGTLVALMDKHLPMGK